MIKKFAGASIWSEDLNNLLPFYRDVIGLKVVHESEGFVVLGEDQSDSATLGLGTHSEVHGRNPDPARHMIGLECDNLIADWKRLKEAGVQAYVFAGCDALATLGAAYEALRRGP